LLKESYLSHHSQWFFSPMGQQMTQGTLPCVVIGRHTRRSSKRMLAVFNTTTTTIHQLTILVLPTSLRFGPKWPPAPKSFPLGPVRPVASARPCRWPARSLQSCRSCHGPASPPLQFCHPIAKRDTRSGPCSIGYSLLVVGGEKAQKAGLVVWRGRKNACRRHRGRTTVPNPQQPYYTAATLVQPRSTIICNIPHPPQYCT
jgi:hypothetical protein